MQPNTEKFELLSVGACRKDHNGMSEVRVGKYTIRLGASQYIRREAIEASTALYPLNGYFPDACVFGSKMNVYFCTLRDYGGTHENWEEFIRGVAKRIKSGERALAWCTGSHGRTGTFAASLIALMEPETQDPIKAIRERHCKKSVETLAQAESIYRLRGESLPEEYVELFRPKPIIPTTVQSHGVTPFYRNVGLSKSDSHVISGNVSWWEQFCDAYNEGELPSWYMKDISEEREAERLAIEKATAFLHKK